MIQLRRARSTESRRTTGISCCRRFYRRVLPVLFLSIPFPGVAQVPDQEARLPLLGYGFAASSWTTVDGLPQNSIHDILDAGEDRIWLATLGGLARFDGETFDVLDVATLPGFRSNQVLGLAKATSGGVWALTRANELLRIDADTIAERIPLPAAALAIRRGLRIDRDGVIWVAATNILHCYDGEAWRSFAWQEGLPATITAIELSSSGSLWVATVAGLTLFAENRFKPIEAHPSLQGVRVESMREDMRGRLWLGTGSGLAVLEREDGLLRPVTVGGMAVEIGRVSAIEIERENELWIGGPWGIAHLHHEPEDSEVRVVYDYPSIDNRVVTRLTRDRRGNTWVGTAGGGLVRFTQHRVWRLTPSDGLPSRFVHHVVGSAKEGVWTAGNCDGLTFVGLGDSTRVTIEYRDVPGATTPCTRALFRDRHGSLWVGMDGHLARLDDDGGSKTWGSEEGLQPDLPVSPIVQDSSGQIWFGYGNGGLGVVRDSTLRLFAPGIGLPAITINAMTFDSVGALWVGQMGTASRVSVSGSDIDDIRVLGEADGIPPGAIRVIHPDRSGHLWVGSYGGGLTRSDSTGRFSLPLVTTAQGLTDNSLSALVEDEQGRFWILGNRGISVVSQAVLDSVITGTRDRLDAVVLDQEDGVPEGNGGSPSGWLDPDGIAWFATIDGVVALATRAFPWNKVVPLPRIEVIQFGHETWMGDGPIVIGGGPTEVSFSFTCACVEHPGAALYRYRLLGQDEHWIYTEAAGVARYPRVPPGSFSFVVEARNEDGVWSAAPAVARFQILPLWWQTVWFRWGSGLLAALLIGTGLLRRVRKAESRNRQLMQAIQERDLAEERIHRQQRELEHVARVATAGELATSLAHELNQPLMAIVSNAAAGDLMLSNPDMGKDVVREALEDIAADGKRASEVIKGLREFLKRGTVEFEQLYVNQVVRDVLVLLGSELRESGVDVRLDLDGDLPTVEGNRVQLQQVLVNLVMNALEAMCSQDTECRLSVKTRSVDEGVSITVHDTGPGLPPGEEDEVFEAFVTTKEYGMGVGLAISRTIVAAHGGRIRAGNQVDGGAEFVITLPSMESTTVSAEPDTALSG